MEWLVSLAGMPAVAKEFWGFFADQKVFAFHGNMGIGKTTFIRALCEAKKVNSTMGSPSFSIINEYRSSNGKIFHLDLYRLKDEEEAFHAGVEDCLHSGEICLVEWPEKAPGVFPPETAHIFISEVDSKTRKIHTEASL